MQLQKCHDGFGWHSENSYNFKCHTRLMHSTIWKVNENIHPCCHLVEFHLHLNLLTQRILQGKGLRTTHSQPLAASIDRLPDDFYDDLQLWFAASLNRVDFNHCWMPIFLRIAQRKKKQKENQLRRNMYMWLFARLARQGTRMTRWVRYTESPCRTISELLLRCVTEIDNNRLWWCLCAGFWCVH